MDDNHRMAPRLRVLKTAVIEFGGGAIDCTICNLSETGAALGVSSPIGIPEQFNLVQKKKSSVRHCRVVWRKPTRIGVIFDETTS